MKIEYKIDKNFFKTYDYVMGIALRKNYIKKHPEKKFRSYTKNGLYLLMRVIVIALLLFFMYFESPTDKMLKIFSITTGCLVVLLFLYYEWFFCSYRSTKKIKQGKLMINKVGVYDTTIDNKTFGFGWNKVEFIIIDNDKIIILVDKRVLFANIVDKEQVIKTIKKYNSDIQLIIR